MKNNSGERTILIIDDQQDYRDTLSTFLSDVTEYHILAAKSGRQGLAVLSKMSVDLVVTDMLMPDMEGVETIYRIKTDFPETKIIAMSGGGRTGNMDFLGLAENQGVYAVLQKPFDLTDFEKLVKDAFASI